MSRFDFKPVDKEDLPLLYTWFELPHVKQWWPTPEEHEDFFGAFLERVRTGLRDVCLVFCDGKPIGYIQSYSVDITVDTWLPALPGTGTIIGLDQFIGEPDYLYKGFGTLFIKEFIKRLIAQEKDVRVIVDPEPENVVAIRCYEKVGFKKLGVYQAPWGSVVVMVYQDSQ